MRAILDAILYVLRTGAAWRHLQREFPPWGSVHRWFLLLSWIGLVERLAHALALAARERTGRDASPTAAVIDAQAARSGGTDVAGERGFDPARWVVGRKRHILTDADGRVLLTTISRADLHDSHGGVTLLRVSRSLWPSLARYFAGRVYTGGRVAGATPIRFEIVGARPGQKGFAVQSWRWVIERTIG